MLRRIHLQQIHQPFRLDIIILNQRLHTIPILLRPHMLMRRKIGNDIKSFLLPEYSLKDRIRKVQCIATELIWHIQPICRTYIANQLRQPILIQIHHDHRCRLKSQHRLDKARPYRSRSTNHTNLLTLYLPRQHLSIRLDIRLKHALRPKCHRIRYKLI